MNKYVVSASEAGSGLHPPSSEAEYDQLVQVLDSLLAQVGDNEDHPLAPQLSLIADWIEDYDESLPRLPGSPRCD